MKKFESLSCNSFQFFTSISDVSVSRNGNYISFVGTKPDIKNNSYISKVYVIDQDGSILYVSKGPNDVKPRWCDDKTLVYLSNNVNENIVRTDLVLWRYGSNANLIHSANKRIIDFKPIDKNQLILHVRDFTIPDDQEYIYSEHIPIWSNSIGFTAGSLNRLYLLDYVTGFIEPLSEVDLNVVSFDFDRDTGTLAYIYYDDIEKPFLNKIILLNLRSMERQMLFQHEPLYLADVSLTSKYIAVKAHKFEHGFASHLKLLVLDITSNKLVFYGAPLGFGIDRRVYHDLRGPNSSSPKLVIRNNKIYYLLSIEGRFSLYAYNTLTDNHNPILDGEFVIDEFDVSLDERKIVYIKSMPHLPAEVYIFKDGEEHQLTGFNNSLNERFNFVRPIKFSYRASDGAEIDGWIMLPISNDKKPVPAILNIHGGPKSKFGYSFMFEHQLYVSHGYAVVYLNPRGSDGYTEDFADIRLKYGTRDYLDIIEGVKYVLRNFKDIDEDRLGVTGISYGGFMTNWIVTHSDLFKAAVSQNGISSWEAMYNTTDIGYYFVPDKIGGSPINKRELLVDKSPLYYAEKVSTPILFIHSMNDYRCFIDQSVSFHTVLRALGKKSAIAIFKEGSHTFGWIGKPRSRLKRYELILTWFNKFLKNSGDTE